MAWICVSRGLQGSKAVNRRIRRRRGFQSGLRQPGHKATEAGPRGRSSCQIGQADEAVLEAHADFIFGARAEAPDTTLDETIERLREERGVTW
jgi:hypothetical protein